MSRRDVKADLPFLVADRDRHGNLRHYVRRAGRKIRIRADIGTEAFLAAYQAALDAIGAPPPGKLRAAPAGTLGWLAAQYFASVDFRMLDSRSQRVRRGVIEDCLREPRKPGSTDLMRACPIAMLSSRHVQMLRDRKAGTPGAANNRLKYLSALFSFAIEAQLMSANPCRDVRRMRYETDGFHTWTDAEVAQFEEFWPEGSKPRLALALLLYTGLRRGDVVRVGRQHIRNGTLMLRVNKTRRLNKPDHAIPIIDELARAIDALPTGQMTFLVTQYGKPFTAAGFGHWFKGKATAAGLAHCTPHGLRKVGVTRAAEHGATGHQLMAMYAWTSMRQAEPYTRAASQKRLAATGFKLLAGDKSGT